MITLEGTIPFDDCVADIVVVDESDKVAENTWNDYGLPLGFYFAGGRRVRAQWVTVWLCLTPGLDIAVRPFMSEGKIGAAKPTEWTNGWRLIITDVNNIASVCVALVDAPPEKLMPYFNELRVKS